MASAVLDTNVVLDCLLFDAGDTRELHAEIVARRLTWVATPAMRAELAFVLQRPMLQRYSPDRERILLEFDSQTLMVAEGAGSLLLCSRDPDDQCFIDGALQAGASWLITRDRDLLSLARRARRHGLVIATPAQWQALRAAAQRDRPPGDVGRPAA